MPTYSYACSSCGHTLEAFQKISEDALKQCPQCKQPALVRGIGGGQASFQFIGGGYYLTDYKSAGAHEHSSSCGCGKKKDSCGS